MTYKKILVAVDTTDEAEYVVKAALEIADKRNSAISIITVIRPMTDFYVNLYSSLEDNAKIGFESQAVASATEWLSGLVNPYGIDDSAVSVIIGTPSVEIRRFAEERDVELIVLGTHGRHGLGLMLGSTANAVLHGAPCDVLAVKVHADGSD